MNKNKNKGLLLVVSGPSGAGKGTICKAYIEKNKNTFNSISATTRKPRDGEIDGESYFFISEEKFKGMIENNELMEWAAFCGNYYGTPKASVEEMLEQGMDVILEIEVQGAMKVRSHYPEGVYMFVLPPSMQELRQRIKNRGTESDDVIEERLKTAAWEFNHITNYNYILLNDSIDKAVQRMEAIVGGENCRVERNIEFIKEVCER